MGNRASVVFTDGVDYSPAVYLHWNGGAESVYAFLDALQRYDALGDAGRTSARFTQLVGNFLGGALSLALVRYSGPLHADIDPGDNGTYLVTIKRGRYTVRRWIDRMEQDAAFVERERTDAYQHRYHTASPLIAQQLDEVNEAIFRGDGPKARTAA